MHFSQLAFAVLLYSSFTAAWPWPPSIQNVKNLIPKRQDSTASSASGTQETNPSQASPSASNSALSASATVTGSVKSSGTASGSAAATSGGSQITATTKGATAGKGNTKTTVATTPTSIDQRLPAGGIQMLTPSALAAPSYYKIGDQITFGWNYTSLVVTPTAIDIIVSCSANSATYTLSNNATVQPTGQVVWDTKRDANGENPLLTDTYTLVIHDAAQDVTAVPSAGHLGSSNQFTFGMYVRQDYTPLNEYVCVTCSGALSDMERQTLKFLFGMGIITVISFTWFAGGFGVF